MNTNRFVIFSLIILSLLLGFLSLQVLRPFLNSIAWGMALTIVFYPVYVTVLRYVPWKSVSSAITLLLILVVMLGPFSWVLFLIIEELKEVTAYFEEGNFATLKDILEHPRTVWLMDRVSPVLGMEVADIGALPELRAGDLPGLVGEALGRRGEHEADQESGPRPVETP